MLQHLLMQCIPSCADIAYFQKEKEKEKNTSTKTAGKKCFGPDLGKQQHKRHFCKREEEKIYWTFFSGVVGRCGGVTRPTVKIKPDFLVF